MVVAGLFLTWLELTVGWLSYALDSSRNRWLTKAWLLGVMTLVAGAFAVTDRRELVVPVLGVAGVFLVYLFVVDGVIALVERRGRRDHASR